MKNIELIDKAIDYLSGKWDSTYSFLARENGDNEMRVYHWLVSEKDIDSLDLVLVCTHSEFEARKAERQNKPDWKDLPPETQWLGQDRCGKWKPMVGPKPNPERGYWVTHHHLNPQPRGEVIGNWQDTLEQRQAAAEPEWPDEERIDIIGTNGNDGLSYATKAPGFNHGAGVFNMIPAGAKCLCWFDDGRECWHECIVIGSIDSEIKNGYFAVSLIGKHERKLVWANEFRPLRTEREKFIEAAMSAAGDYHKLEDILGDLFDAGFRAPDQK